MSLPEPQWLVDGLLPKDGLGFPYGQPGSGKTYLMLDLALTIASGREQWFGRKVRAHGPVIYLAAEGAHSLRARFAAWCLHHGCLEDDVARFWVVPRPVDLMDAVDVQELLTATAGPLSTSEEPAVLTIVDTLSRCSPGMRENLADDATLVVESLDAIRREHGGLVLAVHHAGKHGEAERGSSVFRAAADLMLSIGDQDTHRELKVTKQRDGELVDPIPFRLAAGGGGLVVLPEDGAEFGPRATPGLSPKQRECLRALIDVCPRNGEASAQTWSEACEQSRRTFNRALKVLLDRGLVRRVSRGMYAPSEEAEFALRPRAA